MPPDSDMAEEREPLIGRSPAMIRALGEARRAARSDLPILLAGESGSGKGRLARAIHEYSPRRAGPFRTLSGPEATEALAAREMFGHVRGAFTGADRDVPGVIVGADKGTLAFDDIDKLPLPLQAILLRFLDERTVRVIGQPLPRKIDVRLIVTTNRDLQELVRRQLFLADLAWRLSGLRIHVPPLRDRPEDVLGMIDLFGRKFARQLGRRAPRYSRTALEKLVDNPWPGNVRQLSGVLQNLVLRMGKDRLIREDDVIRELDPHVEVNGGGHRRHGYGPRDPRLAEESLVRAMELAHWNGQRAARDLEVPLRTLRRWLGRYGLTRRKAGVHSKRLLDPILAGGNGNGH